MFEFKLAQYTTAAILVALDLIFLFTMYMLVMVHREFDSVLTMYTGAIPTNTICYKNCFVSGKWLIAAVKA